MTEKSWGAALSIFSAKSIRQAYKAEHRLEVDRAQMNIGGANVAIVMEDIGELAYGGLVTLSEWWDTKRIADAKLAKKDILKKASFYTYLVIGLAATLVSSFNWWRGKEKWMEHVSHGFIYDLPRQIYNNVQSLRTPPGPSSTGESAAVRQAREILAAKAAESVRANARGKTGFEVIDPHEIMV